MLRHTFYTFYTFLKKVSAKNAEAYLFLKKVFILLKKIYYQKKVLSKNTEAYFF